MERFCFLRDTNGFLGVVCKYFFLFGDFECLYQQVRISNELLYLGTRSKCGQLIIDFLLALVTFKEKGLC